MATERSVLDRLRQPEYTGKNRCLPCTAVNAVIAVVVAGGVGGMLVGTGTAPAPATGVAVALLALFVATIYFRGYLVPGTPTLTKRYFPDWVLARFDKLPEDHPDAGTPGAVGTEGAGTAAADATIDDTGDDSETSDPTTDPEEVDAERHLLDAGAVEPCEDVDDLCLTDEFGAAWEREVEALDGADRERIATVLGVEGDAEVNEYGEAFVLTVDGYRVGQWESEAALLSDLASATVLAERYDAWSTLDSVERGQIVGGLRVFVETCPTCGGPVSLSQDTVESCCRTHEVVAAACEDCEDRLLEVGM